MKKIRIIIMLLICLLLGGTVFYMRKTEDTTAPVIQLPVYEENKVWKADVSQEELLADVTAFDETDGDVTESLTVNSIYVSDDRNSIVVTYAAKDSSNNVSKKKVELICENGSETTEDHQNSEKKSDAEQSDIYANELATENSQDTQPENLSEGAPIITLTDEVVTVALGEAVNRLEYVKEITDDKDSSSTLWGRIEITGDQLNTNETGTYKLIYFVTDSDGNKSNEAVLTVIVR